MNTSRGRSGGIVPPRMARAAETNRTGGASASPSIFRAGKKDSKKPTNGSPYDDTMPGEQRQSAGSAGNFKPIPGASMKSPFDANADKGESPAKNDTGKPNTPSGV